MLKAMDGCILVIFGAYSDLTKRKLLPALYNLQKSGKLSNNFAVVCAGRRNKSWEEYIKDMKAAAGNHVENMDETVWIELRERIYYSKLDFNDKTGYRKLNSTCGRIDKMHNTKGNRIFYMASSASFFESITDNLKRNNMIDNKNTWQRVVIEKPFGKDKETAKGLNNKLRRYFKEKDIYRIDHYLAKEMIQNILVLRFANILFEPVWCNTYIDNVQIISAEVDGVGNRAGYYDSSGALRDMIQNHILQLLALITMEKPGIMDSAGIRKEKTRILKSIKKFKEDKSNIIVLGQYGPGYTGAKYVKGYKEEQGVPSNSRTETLAALKLEIENERWEGVPFYILTGKRLSQKTTCVIVNFKEASASLFKGNCNELENNAIIISIQPKEGVIYRFNGRKAGSENSILPVNMDYCHNCTYEKNSPESYERLLEDAAKGNSSLFTGWEEVESSWELVDSIIEFNRRNCILPFIYESGSKGLKEVEKLTAQDNRIWYGWENCNKNT